MVPNSESHEKLEEELMEIRGTGMLKSRQVHRWRSGHASFPRREGVDVSPGKKGKRSKAGSEAGSNEASS